MEEKFEAIALKRYYCPRPLVKLEVEKRVLFKPLSLKDIDYNMTSKNLAKKKLVDEIIKSIKNLRLKESDAYSCGSSLSKFTS